VNASVSDAHAQRERKFLTRMLGVRINVEHARKEFNIFDNFFKSLKQRKFSKIAFASNKWSIKLPENFFFAQSKK
jgi:hypothetical protein